MKSIHSLEVIFKIAERCNINCTYCYYFNMGEDTAMGRPALVDIETCEVLAKAIAQGCIDMDIPVVRLHFHGGEPLMVKPKLFESICKTFIGHISPVAGLSLYMQTNGVLINEQWLKLFDQYGVSVGFSIDGDREAHDRYRLSKNGRSTFDITEKNLKWMIARSAEKETSMPSTISVVDPQNNYQHTYAYIRSLGIERMSFLLPDRNADDENMPDEKTIREFGRSLCEIFEAWLSEDNTKISVRHIDRLLHHFKLDFRQKESEPKKNNAKEKIKKDVQIIIARSDGTMAVNDTFIPALSWYKHTPVYSMKENSLKDFLSHEIFDEIDEIENTLPTTCGSCKWRKICKGGDIENRYSEQAGFDNPSVYCEAYKYYFENICHLLVDNGYPAEMIPTV